MESRPKLKRKGFFSSLLDLSDKYVSRACLFDNYEPAETAFVKNNLREGAVFLDIGANIGWFSILASTIVGTSGRVVAFEPRPTTRHYLKKTIQYNELNDVVSLYQFGLSDRPGEAFINAPIGTHNPGGSFVTDMPAGPNMNSERIELRTLDSFNLDRVDFIKIDVEGSEPKVFTGAYETIRRNRPIIMAEINPIALQTISNQSPDDLIGFFHKLDYKVMIIDHLRGGEIIESYPANWGRDIMNIGAFPN